MVKTLSEPDSELNPGERHWDDEFGAQGRGQQTASNLHGQEIANDPDKTPGSIDMSEFEKDFQSSDANDSADAVNQAEQSSPGSWKNNTGQAAGAQKTTGKTLLKRGLPIAGISGILVTLGMSLSLIFSPALLLVHIKEALEDKFNIQSSALDKRTNKILAKKIAGTATANCGTVINIRCKFNKMSDKLLGRMKDGGLIPVDKNGNPLEISDKGWGSQRPYGFMNPEGDFKIPVDKASGKEIIKAGDLSKFLRDNPEAGKVFQKAFNPHWTSFWDSTFNKWMGKLPFGNKAPKVTGDNEKSVDDSITKAEDGNFKESGAQIDPAKTAADPNGAQNAAEADAANTVTKDAGQAAEADVAKEIKAKLKGGGLLVANLFCLVKDASKIGRALRAVQMAQILSFGLLFLQMADKIKAGDATPEEVSGVASKFTQSLVDSSGATTKKAATDSDAMMYGLNGNTKLDSKTANYVKYIPGGGFIALLVKLGDTINNGLGPTKGAFTSFCSALANPVLSGGLTFAMDFTPGGFITAAIQTGLAASGVIDTLVSPLMKMLAGHIVDSKALYEDFGNAAAIGMIDTFGQAANAGAMMPMTVAQAVAYSHLTTETRLANAKIDRATLSPFDVTSPNTFLGSIYTKMIPYYGAITSSPIGSLGAISSLVGSSFSAMLTPGAFADSNLTESDLKSCPDTSITETGIAAGPVCDVQYAIPTEYLDVDPGTNVDNLTSQGLVGDDGTPTGDLASWLGKCATGDSTADDPDCVIKDATHASYALYAVDHRLQANMDGEEDYSATGGGSTSGGSFATLAPGTDLVQAVKQSKGKSLQMQAGNYTFSDFADGGGYAGVEIPASTPSFVGAGVGQTIVGMVSHTSTKAGKIPAGPGSYSPDAATNPLWLMKFYGSPTMSDFTLQGTDQGHLYNGIELAKTQNAKISNIKVVAIPGHGDAPPPETAAFNGYHDVNTVADNVEVDGGGVGAAGYGGAFSANSTIKNSYFHDMVYSNGMGWWMSNNITVTDVRSLNNKDFGANFERCGGTITLTRFTTTGNRQGDIRVASDLGSAKVTIIDPVFTGKLKIRVDTHYQTGQKQQRSDIHVIMGGQDVTNSVVQWMN